MLHWPVPNDPCPCVSGGVAALPERGVTTETATAPADNLLVQLGVGRMADG